MSPRRIHLNALLLFGVLGLLVAQLWSASRSHHAQILQVKTEVVGRQVASNLQACIGTRLAMVEAMGREWTLGGLRDEPDFRARAASLIQTFPGYQAINWVTPDGRIALVHPVEGNEAALGQDLFAHPSVRVDLEEVRELRVTRISSPIELYQGGIGIAGYVPLLDGDGAYSGLINAVFRGEALLDSCIGEVNYFVLEVLHGGGRLYREGPTAKATGSAGLARDFPVRFGEEPFVLRIAPSREAELENRGPGLWALFGGLAVMAVIAGLYDLASQSRAEREHLALELARARGLEVLGRLAAGVAHDFNNLLTIVQFASDSLRDTPEEAKRQARLDEIDVAVGRAVALTRQMLSLARRRVTRLQPTSVTEVVDGMAPLLRRLVPDEVELRISLGQGPAMVLGDAVRIEQILLNLVTNAGDACTAGGHIDVKVDRIGAMIVLQVVDEGRGMDPGTLQRIYEPFFTTKGQEGTGLGLATVREHVYAMGAVIDVLSTPGTGTRVEVRWPALFASSVARPEPEPAPQIAAAPRVRDLRVLLVEDSDDLRSAASRALEDAGYQVLEARHGLEAIAILEADACIAAVVTDGAMPEAGGGEIIEWASTHRPHLPVVLVSGFVEGAIPAGLIQRESVLFVAKPFSTRVLLSTVAKAVSWGRRRQEEAVSM